jgi:signal transduction histidine kinase
MGKPITERLGLSHRLIFTLVALVMVAVASTATAFYFGWQTRLADRAISHEVGDIRAATDLQTALFRQRIGVGAYLMSGEHKWRQLVGGYDAEVRRQLSTLRKSADRAEESALIEGVAATDAEYDAVRERVLALYDSDHKAAAVKLFLGEMIASYETDMSAAEKVRELDRNDMRKALAHNQTAMFWLETMMAVSAALTMLLGASLLWLLFRKLLWPLRQMATEVQAASDGQSDAPEAAGEDDVAKLGYYLRMLLTEQVKTRSVAEEKQARDEHTERLAAVGTAVAHVSHEIKNALTSIGGFASFIQRHADDPERVREQAAIIFRSATQLDHLVRQTMDYSRPNAPAPMVQSLNAVVKEALAVISGRVPEGVKLEVALDPTIPDVCFDAAHLERVIANLVGNALEAVGPRGRVVVRTNRGEKGATLSVEDNGPGIPPAIHERLFEPFFSTKKKGTGLGLAICREIVAGHGGSICHEPAPSGGTVFRVTLPPA